MSPDGEGKDFLFQLAPSDLLLGRIFDAVQQRSAGAIIYERAGKITAETVNLGKVKEGIGDEVEESVRFATVNRPGVNPCC